MKYAYYAIALIAIFSIHLLADNIKFTVVENIKVGHKIGNICSKLKTSNSCINLEMISNDGKESLFMLDKQNGDLFVKSYIDRETICEKKEECRVTLVIDLGSEMVTVVIVIEDENDNAPIFPVTHKSLTIQENTANGTLFPLPIAQDADSVKYGITNYTISQFKAIDDNNKESYLTEGSQYFKVVTKSNKVIEPSLQIIRNIDREEFISFVFLLIATDSGQKSGTCTVTVHVTDVNDNSPEWKRDSYRVVIKECQLPGELLEFGAIDRDDPQTRNGKITYRFSDKTEDKDTITRVFYINENKLYLSNNRISELIKRDSLRLYVDAADGNGRMSGASIDIAIQDCNDHVPKITLTRKVRDIYENRYENIVLAIVKVVDEDTGRNGLFTCTLNDTSRFFFEIKHSLKNFIVYKIETRNDTSFDRERMSTYSVEIECTDQGNPIMRSSQIFSVNIIDVNDNAPHFESTNAIFYVLENNAIGTTIGRVLARDADDGENGFIVYSIAGDSDFFTISTYGEIQSKVKFDRESNDTYTFTVIATDKGNPPLNSSIFVKVIIQDVNDCPPLFLKDYMFEVEESYSESIKSVLLGQVKATDKDSGKNGVINYKLVDIRSSGSDTKDIRQHLKKIVRVNYDGAISIYGTIDREVISSFQLIIKAYDNGNPSLSTETTVLIKVLDVNDNSPKFVFPDKHKKPINVSLDSEIGTKVGQIETVDPDNGVNGSVTHQIVNSNSKDPFPYEIHSTGQIIVSQDLKVYQTNHRLPDKLLIKAEDNGDPKRSSLATLFVVYSKLSVSTFEKPIKDQTSNGKNSESNSQYSGKINKNRSMSDNMVLLYSLATILFVIFIIVLAVLLYVYCSKRYMTPEGYLKKICKTDNPTLNGESNLKELRPYVTNLRLSQDCLSTKMDENAAVCFLNDETSNYTHLMMLNNYKYTPMLHTVASPTAACHLNNRTISIHDVNQNNFISDSSPNISSYLTTTPRLSRAPIKKTNVFSQEKDNQNYATLRDQVQMDFNTIKTNAPRTERNNSLKNSDFSAQHKDLNSSYVTSSFV